MVRVLMCGPLEDSGGVSNHTKNLMKELSLLDTEVLFYNFSNKRSSNLKLTYFKKTYRRTFGLLFETISKKNHYDLIHVQSSGGIASFLSSIAGVLASKIVNKKCVVTFHHSKTNLFVNKYKFIFGFVLRFSDKMILVSEMQKGSILDIFPKYSNKLVVIPNGYDSSLFYPMNMLDCRNVLGLSPTKKIILNISNLIESKGHKFLVESINHLIKEFDDICCYIIGQGYFYDELKNQIEESNLNNYV